MPTAQRAPTAMLLRRGGERLLFDCAEGTQRQLLRSNVGLIELREIFLTHYHADHYLGLPGMLKTFALRGRELPDHDLRPARPPRPVLRAPADLRKADLPLRARRAGSGRAARARRVRARDLPGRARRVRDRVRARRAAEARPVRRRRRRRARDPRGAGAGCAPGRRVGDAARRAGADARRRPRPGAPRPEGRDRGRHGVRTLGRGRGSRRRSPRPRGHVRRGRAGPRARDAALDGARGGGGRADRRGRDARADPPVEPLLRRRDRAGGPVRLPGHGRAPRPRYHRRPVPGAGRTGAREGRSHAPASQPAPKEVVPTVEEAPR